MSRIGILADDFTGAADTASQFVLAGWQAELQLRPGISTAQVLAVTTDSRNLDPAQAARAVTTAVARLREAGVTHLYKKIDSTLRGQLAGEIRAAMEAWSSDALAVVCPAFPAMGRTLVDGILLVHDRPVSDTDLGADAVTPVTQSHVPTLLGVAHVARADGESAESLADRIGAHGPVVVVDAHAEDDLHQLGEALVLLGPRAIPVGSAGLARHLAQLWRAEPNPDLRFSSVSSAVKGTIAIVIVTSLQDTARRQASCVAAAGARHAQPAPQDLIEDHAWAAWSGSVIDGLAKTDTMLLLTAPLDRRRYLPAGLIPERFADLTKRIINTDRVEVSGVVATGGDGARAVAEALGATGFQVRGEVTTGVAIGTLAGGPASGLLFVTKAGGFGDADALLRGVQAVREWSHA